MTHPTPRDGTRLANRRLPRCGGGTVDRPAIVLAGPGTGAPADDLAALDRAIAAAAGCPVIVAHGRGAFLLARWAATAGARAARVTGAVLVAPFDGAPPGTAGRWRHDAAVPRHAMPFPTIMVVPPDGPDLAEARGLARAWSAELRTADRTGPIGAGPAAGDADAGIAFVDLLVRRSASRWRRPLARRIGARH